MKKINITLAALAVGLAATAQTVTIKSKVTGTDNQPIAGAIVTIVGGASAVTDAEGNFEISAMDSKALTTVKAPGYYDSEFSLSYLINHSDGKATITLVPQSETLYNGYVVTPMGQRSVGTKNASTAAVEQKDYSEKLSVGAALRDGVAGLQAIEKSGMPGEGTYLNLRGIHTLMAENNPLIVINGVPYFTNQNVSDIIQGYSRDLLFGYSPKDVRSVTVLKGSEAAQWGVLGSNGVIVIETQTASSDNLNTRITFSGQYGMNIKNSTMPTLNATQYKSYMSDLGLTLYPSFSSLTNDYPFLQNSSSYTGAYLFNENMNWMKEIQRTGFVTDNMLRVEGGDEIAKYNISFGYTGNNGVLRNTNSDRYHTSIAADVLVSRQIDIFTNVALSYINSNLQNTGMQSNYNPLTSAYWNSPLISAYKKQSDGGVLPEFATYNAWNISSNPMFAYNNVSNPLALVETVQGTDKIYDANANIGINFRLNDYLTLTAMANLYYNYTEEYMFVPGKTNNAILPGYYGQGKNYVSSGVIRQMTDMYSFSANYKRIFNRIHELNTVANVRVMNHSIETDFGSGYNTPNDYFTTLDNTTEGKTTGGDNYEWNYLDMSLQADYTYNKILRVNAGLNVDGTSASGADATRLGFFPSAGVTYMLANTGLIHSSINKLNFSVEGSLTGNARFSSNYGKNYYVAGNLFGIGGLRRSNVPNTKLSWEKTQQLDLGIDFAALKNRLSATFNYYLYRSYDLLFNNDISKVYGSTYYYDNTGEIAGTGYEFAIRGNIFRTKNWDVTVGISAAHNHNELKKLGDTDRSVIKFNQFNGDDAEVVMNVGDNPYQFYGYKTAGVYATTSQAAAAGLVNAAGIAYQAGDMIYVDQNGDGIINEKDKVAIGNATPDVFGALNLSVRYKAFTLDANFGYSIGNDAYNATRRQNESMDKFYNQSTAVLGRWQVEGQNTTIPRAVYGDAIGNTDFSDRWIEDASYLKLRSLRLSYSFSNFLGFIRSGNLWVAGENLFSITKYLGADPEFAYGYTEAMRGFDYCKLSMPRTIKIGFDLNF